jgi:hypothetical protein
MDNTYDFKVSQEDIHKTEIEEQQERQAQEEATKTSAVPGVPTIPEQETKTPAPYNQYLYKEQAEEDIGAVYDPLIEGAEQQKAAIDIGAEMKIEGITKAIPYITRQFEAYQAKQGLGTGMQMRQSNELIMDIAETIGEVYDIATLQKLGVDSKISEYQSAMAAGELSRATELYNQAQSQAMFASEILGQDYIQPEIGFMYDQMTAAEIIINNPDASEEEKSAAQATTDSLTQALKDLGYTGEVGEGLKTYQQYQRELEQYYVEVQDFIASETFDATMYSNSQTFQALQYMQAGHEWDEALTLFPFADVDKVIEIQGKITTGDLTWDIGDLPDEE